MRAGDVHEAWLARSILGERRADEMLHMIEGGRLRGERCTGGSQEQDDDKRKACHVESIRVEVCSVSPYRPVPAFMIGRPRGLFRSSLISSCSGCSGGPSGSGASAAITRSGGKVMM